MESWPVAVRPVLPGPGRHRGPPRPAAAAAAHARRRGARREGLAPAQQLAALKRSPRRARGGPALPHPVPEGLPAPRARALQRPHRAADPRRRCSAIVQRSLDPQQVAVLVRRTDAKGDKGRPPRLVVAAAYPEGAAVKVGTEVAARHRARSASPPRRRSVLNRQDLEAETAQSRIKPGPALAGHAAARPHRAARVRPGDARRDRGARSRGRPATRRRRCGSWRRRAPRCCTPPPR